MLTDPTNHRVVLEFDDGVYVKKLIHPEGGCVGADQCGHCAADLTDPDSTRCYDCKGEGPHECWVQGWFDNASAEELLHGRIEVEINCRWEFDHMEAHVVGAQSLSEQRS